MLLLDWTGTFLYYVPLKPACHDFDVYVLFQYLGGGNVQF